MRRAVSLIAALALATIAATGPGLADPVPAAPRTVAAAEARDAAPPPDEPRLTDAVRDHDRRVERRVVGTWGASVSEELVIAPSIGFVRTRMPESFDCATTCEYRGLFGRVEPGLGGGKLIVGHARLVGETQRLERFLAHVYFGYAVGGSVMRTWSDHSSEAPGQTWAGVEGNVTAVMVRFSLGLYHHVSGDADDGWLVSAGIGWGF